MLVRKERSQGPVSGPWSYNELIYPLSSILHLPTPTTPAGATLTRDWLFKPSNFLPDTVQSYTIEVGSALGATTGERMVYALFNAYTMRATDEDTSTQGELIGKAFIPGITLTASPTIIPEAVVNTINLSWYLGSAFTNKVQLLSLGSPSAGTFTITVQSPQYPDAVTTTAIAFNAASSAVLSALEALTVFDPGDVTVTGAAGGPYTVTTLGMYAGLDVPSFTINGAGLTGGSPTVTVTTAGGMTQLKRIHEFEFGLNGRFTIQDTMDASERSWSYAVERPPDVTSRVVIQHDAVSQTILTALRAAQTRYIEGLAFGNDVEAGFKHAVRIRIPVKFQELEVADRNDVQAATYQTAVIYDATLDGAVEILIRNGRATL